MTIFGCPYGCGHVTIVDAPAFATFPIVCDGCGGVVWSDGAQGEAHTHDGFIRDVARPGGREDEANRAAATVLAIRGRP